MISLYLNNTITILRDTKDKYQGIQSQTSTNVKARVNIARAVKYGMETRDTLGAFTLDVSDSTDVVLSDKIVYNSITYAIKGIVDVSDFSSKFKRIMVDTSGGSTE